MRKGIIALDLDGTLLNSQKKLSERNLHVLYKATEIGWEIVPTTGRFYDGIPEIVRKLPFIKYAITVNGAAVINVQTDEVIYKAEMKCEKAIEIMRWLDKYPVIYDCFMDNSGWMTETLKQRIDEVVENPYSRKMLHELRKPVKELKLFLEEKKHDVQKVQFFVKDPLLRIEMMNSILHTFDNVMVSSALPQNVEINQVHANKGEALMALAKYLKVKQEETVSFGDGLNDLSMIEASGVGIAMYNGCNEIKKSADWIVSSCDEDGVAEGIEKFCLK